jgi:hypothetical protein
MVHADTLILENNRELTGEVRKTDTEYVVKLKNGIVTRIPIGDVVRWEKDETPAPAVTGDTPEAIPLPPSAAPTRQRPAVDPSLAMAKSSQSLGLGLKAFKAGDPVAAYENFLDSYQVLKVNGIPIDPNKPVHFTLLACLGASCVANLDYPHANAYLSAASASKLHDPSVALNQDIVDYVQHVNALRAVKNLAPTLGALEDEDIPKHEFEINILGATLEYLGRDEEMLNNDLFKRGGEVYLHVRNALDKAHPQKIQWGGRWLPREEGRALRTRFAAEYARWKVSLVQRDHAYQAMKNAEAKYAEVKGASLGGNSIGGGLASARANKLRATDAYDAIKDEPPKLKKLIDWPEWPPFPPAKPDVTEAMAALADGSSQFSITRSAVAVPIGPDLVVTSSVAVADATDIQAADATGLVRSGKVLRKDGLLGLALVRLEGKPLAYLNLGSRIEGNKFACWALPEVTVDKPAPEALPSSASVPNKATWAVSVSRHPRLPGAAIVDVSGSLVGIALGERASESSQVPAVPLDQLRSFLGSDTPATPGGKPDVNDILELRASH